MNSPILLHAWIRSQTREFRRIARCQNLSDKSATCLGKWTWRIAVDIVWSSVSSTTSSFVPRRRAHNVGTWFFPLAPRPYRRPHTARNVSEAEFGQLDKLAGMRSDPTRFLLPTTLLTRKNAAGEHSFELSVVTGFGEDKWKGGYRNRQSVKKVASLSLG